MQKIINEKFTEFELVNPCHIMGGDGKTKYTGNQGSTGTDCYSDDDGDGELSSGDGILLDNGQWINKA